MKKQILFLAILLSCSVTYAQNVGIGTSTPQARLHVADSNVLYTGQATLPTSANPVPINGAGTRFMWYADKAALRVGGLTTNNPNRWRSDSIGIYSIAMGLNAKASGDYSAAIGRESIAKGIYATAIGDSVQAEGNSSLAIGNGTKTVGLASFASGAGTVASGDYSSAMGYYTAASGNYAISSGYGGTASGQYSNASGYNTAAIGDYATAMGRVTTAKAKYSVAMGAYTDNSDAPSATTEATTDRIFQIGNGTSASLRSNALTALRNGNFGFGTVDPSQKIDIANGRLRFSGNPSASISQGIEFTNNDGSALNGFVGQYNDSIIGMYGFTGAGWQFLWNGKNGNLGLQGNNNPRAALSFANSGGNKIALYGNAETPHYGFGIGTGLLQMYCANAADNIAFGYGSSTNFTEVMRIKGNGNVGIGTTTPAEKLDVAGNAKVSGNVKTTTFTMTSGAPVIGDVLTATSTNGDATWSKLPSTNTGFRASLATSTSTQGLVLIQDNNATMDFDDGLRFNNLTNSYTVATAGVYQFNYNAKFATGGTYPASSTYAWLDLKVNNITVETKQVVIEPTAYYSTSTGGSTTLKLAVGDVVNLNWSTISPLVLISGSSNGVTNLSGFRIY